ncbi:MAG: DUF21 domain-containing protein, partial [Bacteroidales bacterium]|nr:DUF21 domain-containing protein [Bacteroidales bacterium]
VANTVGAAGVGAQVIKLYGDTWFGWASAGLTLLILIFSEIIPKTFGARYWRKIAIPIGTLIQIMVIISYPLVMLSSVITRLLSAKSKEQTTSREEISALANIGSEEGILGEKENKIIQNLIRLKTTKTFEIMTPRVVVSIADEKMKLEDFLKSKDYLRFSRIPVYSENDENITGYIFRQTVFEKLAEDIEGLTLADLKRNIIFVHDTKPLFSVWEQMLEAKEHIAVVVDEYGGFDGIVTMEDIIETLLGFEIVDEKDTITDMQQYARERWKIKQEKYKHIIKLDSQENTIDKID